MGTEKRQRQKANRALKHQQELKQQRTETLKRKGLRIGLLTLVAFAGVVGIAWVGGAFDGDDDGAISTPTTTTAVDGTPVTVPGASTPTDTTPGDATATDPAPVDPTECPPADGSEEQLREFAAAPPMCIDPAATYTAEVTTNFGDLTIELDAARAPTTVNNFVVLARYRYFDDTVCHRIIPDFVIQCGDPTATGTGGPGYQFPDELPEADEYQIGSLAMANSGADTNGSQFFIISGPDGAALPPQYSLFGQVADGLDTTVAAMDGVGNPDPAAGGVPPLEEVRIARVAITES